MKKRWQKKVSFREHSVPILVTQGTGGQCQRVGRCVQSWGLEFAGTGCGEHAGDSF